MNKINNMFYNLNKKNNLSIMDLDSYFCEKEICTFYRKMDSKIIPKKADGFHLTLLSSKDIVLYFNKKLTEYIDD